MLWRDGSTGARVADSESPMERMADWQSGMGVRIVAAAVSADIVDALAGSERDTSSVHNVSMTDDLLM